MIRIIVLTTAMALLIIMSNFILVAFLTSNSNSADFNTLQNAYAQMTQPPLNTTSKSLISEAITPSLLAPVATSGNNVYVVWWINTTGNFEVMFRASTDGGKTFGDKINLSNSTKADSQDAQIDTFGDRVFVTWWERNATSNEPLLRTSTDMGATFGPIMKLSANGTIGSSAGGAGG
jgi:hypothetical protein